MRFTFGVITFLLFTAVTNLFGGTAQTFTSGPQRVSLIELYTSEGCSSCPPAESWLNGLRESSDLWKKFVPIAFHVTYWNYLGWTDAASQDAFNERQRDYSASWRSSSVYTPCFVRNGREWHREGETGSDSEKIGILTLNTTADNQVEVVFQAEDKGDYQIHLATIGNGLETKVRAGENAGRTLRHDFVALSLQNASPGNSARFVLPASSKNPPAETGLVAWVTKRGEINPLQAVGGILSK